MKQGRGDASWNQSAERRGLLYIVGDLIDMARSPSSPVIIALSWETDKDASGDVINGNSL